MSLQRNSTKRIMKSIVTMIVIALMVQSCARVIHESETSKSKGIRYYNPSAYLLVYPNGKGGLTTQLLYIADPFKKMSMKPVAFMAKTKLTDEFEKGVYKKGNDEMDATGFPKAIVDAVKTLAPAIADAVMNDPKGAET